MVTGTVWIADALILFRCLLKVNPIRVCNETNAALCMRIEVLVGLFFCFARFSCSSTGTRHWGHDYLLLLVFSRRSGDLSPERMDTRRTLARLEQSDTLHRQASRDCYSLLSTGNCYHEWQSTGIFLSVTLNSNYIADQPWRGHVENERTNVKETSLVFLSLPRSYRLLALFPRTWIDLAVVF